MDRRTVAFAALVSACTAVAGVTVALAVAGNPEPVAAQRGTPVVRPPAQGQPYLVYRSLDRSRGVASYGALAVRQGDRRAGGGGMACERVYAVASAGICLARKQSLTASYEARILGPDLRVRHTVKLAGVPSRARVSADGRYGSSTTFVSGHSYAKPGQFSTQTALYDMRRGKRIADIERFALTDGGRRIDAPDVNLWGVTFDARDSDHFYATLATGGKTHLVEGSVRGRRARVIHDNVECPSLSPDGTRIGFKKLVGKDPAVWRFHVLDLETGRETPLAEERPIDDQLEWLDDANLLYRSGEQIWTVRADGSGAAREYLAAADSPAVVR